MKKLLILLLFTLLANFYTYAQNEKPTSVNENIRLNQIGFYPDEPKIAVVTAQGFSKFSILAPNQKAIFTGILKESANPALNGKKTLIAKFFCFSKTWPLRSFY